MADEEEVAVTIEADPQEQKEEKVETRDSAVDDLAKQYAELKARDDERERARQAAEQRAMDAHNQAQRLSQEAAAAVYAARSQVAHSQLGQVETALAAANTEAESALAEYVSAMEAGDFARAGKAQMRMSEAKSDAAWWRQSKAQIEAEAAAQQNQERVPDRSNGGYAPQAPQQPADPVESYIQGRSPKTADWLRAHKEFITDQRKNAKLTAAHYDAVAEGLTPDTDAYFMHVESRLGLGKQQEATSRSKRGGAPTAPVSASGGSISGGTEVRLSPSEAKAAQDGTLVWNYDDPSGQKRFRKGDPIGVQEFARRKLEMQKSGFYDKSYTEQ